MRIIIMSVLLEFVHVAHATWPQKATLQLCEKLCLFSHFFVFVVSRGSAVGIATAYGLEDRGVGVRVPVGSEFSLLHIVQTGSWADPGSYPMRALSPGVKRPGREADRSPPASAKVKKMWIYTSTPPYAFMA
jgi:hypothetical protein